MASNLDANGIVNVVKPPWMTSHDVVNHIRRAHGLRKVGHTGTLDPMASGLMTVCVGKATKISEYLLSGDKRYRAEITFGVKTDTQDIWGSIVEQSEQRPSEESLEEALASFKGWIMQKPPMYSAVRHKGKKLYELAREGIVVEREPRKVEIKSLELVHFNPENAILDIWCSKGTYIRTLCQDIGKILGCGATMSFLLRTASGPFALEDAVPYDCEDLMSSLIATDKALDAFEAIRTHESFYNHLVNGRSVNIPLEHEEGRLYRIYAGNQFIGIGKIISASPARNEEWVKIEKLLV